MKWGTPMEGGDYNPSGWDKMFAWLPVHTAKLYGTGHLREGGRWVWLETVERRQYGMGLSAQWQYREIGDGDFTRNGKPV